MCAAREDARNRTDRLIQSMDRLASTLERVIAVTGAEAPDVEAEWKVFFDRLKDQPPLILSAPVADEPRS